MAAVFSYVRTHTTQIVMGTVLILVLWLRCLGKILLLPVERLVLLGTRIIGYVLPYVQIIYGGIIMYVCLRVRLERLRIYLIYVWGIVILEVLIKMVCVSPIVLLITLILTLVFAQVHAH